MSRRTRIEFHGSVFSVRSVAGSLLRTGLEDAERGLGRDDPCQRIAGTVEELAELLFRALLAAGHDQHLEIEDLAHAGLVAGRDHRLDEDDAAVPGQDLADAAENLRRLVVVP